MKKTILLSVFAICLCALKTSAQTSKPKDSVAVFSIADSATYTGKYKYEGLPFEYMEISVKNGKLAYLGGEYNGALEPSKDKKDAFDADGVAFLTFLRNAESKVAELQIDYQGQSFVGKRENK
jgi:cytochrome c